MIDTIINSNKLTIYYIKLYIKIKHHVCTLTKFLFPFTQIFGILPLVNIASVLMVTLLKDIKHH